MTRKPGYIQGLIGIILNNLKLQQAVSPCHDSRFTSDMRKEMVIPLDASAIWCKEIGQQEAVQKQQKNARRSKNIWKSFSDGNRGRRSGHSECLLSLILVGPHVMSMLVTQHLYSEMEKDPLFWTRT